MSAGLRALTPLLALLLGGCSSDQFWLLKPRGPTAQASFDSLLVDVGAMMLIIGPTTLLLVWCIWRYRRATGKGAYHPAWSHSLAIEILSWGLPLLIVAFLSIYSLRSTFAVNPFDPGIMAQGRAADNDKPPVDVDVITTDWQWLFIYPDRHIASANELVVPVRTPVRLRMTSVTVPNDFFVPQLAGQIDVMPGMLTRQAFIANRIGTYQGLAADFSGPGFSWMQFRARVVSAADFERWAADAGASAAHLDDAAFERFAVPTINSKGTVRQFSNVDGGLFGHAMDEVMMGKTYPTPANMTEKKASYNNDRRQQNQATPAQEHQTGNSQ